MDNKKTLPAPAWNDAYEKAFAKTFRRPFTWRLNKKGQIEFRDKTGPVFVLRPVSNKPYDPDKHAIIMTEMTSVLNGQPAQWEGINKNCDGKSILYFSFESFYTIWADPDRSKYDLTTLDEILVPYLAFHIFKGTSDYGNFVLSKFYEVESLSILNWPKNEDAELVADKPFTYREDDRHMKLESAVEKETEFWRKAVTYEFVANNLDTAITKENRWTPSPEQEKKAKRLIKEFLSSGFNIQTKKSNIEQLADSLVAITAGDPGDISAKREDLAENLGMFDPRVNRYYCNRGEWISYTFDHSPQYNDIITLPVNLKMSVWAFRKPEHLVPENAKRLIYRDSKDGNYQHLINKHKLDRHNDERYGTRNSVFRLFDQYCDRYGIHPEEFATGLPFPYPTDKRTQKDISEYVSACLLVMGVAALPSTIQRYLTDYNTFSKEDRKRGVEPPDRNGYLQRCIKQLLTDDNRILVVPEAWDYDFEPDMDLIKNLFQTEN
jgi:hypothetical protein